MSEFTYSMARKGGILCQASTAAMRFVVSAIFLIWACSVCALPQQDEYYGDVQEAQPPYGQQDQSGYDQQNQPGYDQQDQSGYGQQDQSGYYGPSQAEYDESGSPEYQDSDQTQYDESDQTQYQRTEPGTTNVEVRPISLSSSIALGQLKMEGSLELIRISSSRTGVRVGPVCRIAAGLTRTT